VKDHYARAAIKALLAERVERDRRYTERFDAQEKAVLKAEVASEKRFDGVNEFRRTLSDQAGTFTTRAEMDARFEAVNTTLKRLEAHDNASTGKGIGMSQLWTAALAVAGLVIAAMVGLAGFLK